MTTPTPALWRVNCKSYHYENHPVIQDFVPTESCSYVLAQSKEEAIKKAAEEIEKIHRNSDIAFSREITAEIVDLKKLIAASGPHSGSLGLWKEVELSCPEDRAKYRLSVCLVPLN